MAGAVGFRALSRIRREWKRRLPGLILPLWIRPGLVWLARNDALGDQLFTREFERNERDFVASFIGPGMVAVDVGANAGLYSMIAAKRAGPSGRVIAFEPSPRELRQLRTHLRLNSCANVVIEEVALGDAIGHGDLLVVEGHETGCNSFHLSESDAAATRPLRVVISTLDEYYRQGRLPRVDFIKLDVEGAELSVLRGAARLFHDLRPVLLCEIVEERTAPWRYRGVEIIELVKSWEYEWFAFAGDGRLERIPSSQDTFSGNFVAFPVRPAAPSS
jgi:FkbM family methyltransferase